MKDYRYLLYETLDDGTVARIYLNRPETRNAQNGGLLHELNDAFLQAELDEDVKVVILGGKGPSFSSGHDLGSPEARAEREGSTSKKEGVYARWMGEWERYFTYTQRWRDLRKVTVAQVQGNCLAGGLILAWACDFIVAAEDAVFADIVGARLDMCGLEWFAHPWEFGSRKAKELLMTGDSIDAEEAYRLGMVSKVFPVEKHEEETLNFARRIAKLPMATLLMIKESVNQTQDNQGFYNALRACFSIHQMNHAHWAEVGAARFREAVQSGETGDQLAGGRGMGSTGDRVRQFAPIRMANKSSSGLAPVG